MKPTWQLKRQLQRQLQRRSTSSARSLAEARRKQRSESAPDILSIINNDEAEWCFVEFLELIVNNWEMYLKPIPVDERAFA